MNPGWTARVLGVKGCLLRVKDCLLGVKGCLLGVKGCLLGVSKGLSEDMSDVGAEMDFEHGGGSGSNVEREGRGEDGVDGEDGCREGRRRRGRFY